MLSRVDAFRLRVPLKVPYHLSFGDVEAFDTLLVVVQAEPGREGFGEATLLTGYTDETIEGSWALAQRLARAMHGREAGPAKEAALRAAAVAPFTVTAFVTAVEMLEGSSSLRLDRDVSVPILGTINETDRGRMREEIDALAARGYRTLKIKVGTDVGEDASRVAGALEMIAGRCELRVDANQGYSAAEAVAFSKRVPRQGIELFEQPCAAGDWDAHQEVARRCPLPLMLDESIYNETDIDRAARSCAARYLKVKLMKFASIDRLRAAVERIRAGGMSPVLGNGVATDVGCWMEACVAAQCVDTAGEMNGWLKPHRPLFREPMRVEHGAIRLRAGYRPRLDWDLVDPLVVARVVAA